MSLVFFAIVAFSIFRCGSATSNYPEMNPELGKYQDASAVFPLSETWYAAYRNYEDDPVFGTSKCLGFTEAQPEEDGGYPVVARYGQESQSLIGQVEALNTRRNIQAIWRGCNGVITLGTSEGYNTKNLIVLQPEGQDQSLTLFVSYLDPGKCGVNRNLYVDETACTVFVPESQLGKNTTCCDFVYDLLCGTTKHQIYDSSCDKQGK
ncbi:secreted protein, putative [Ixodes scapularis]|uniref:Secreted protein, putative n=1 Tax=Ixodes scapularis TaxID=6945 RepID=B7Q125_IXOSC|nr:secreted protein, putative [Ixodes scapularis]|eukprot:XP_002408866.1 secreted protein, putative [Ixodes scapularis]